MRGKKEKKKREEKYTITQGDSHTFPSQETYKNKIKERTKEKKKERKKRVREKKYHTCKRLANLFFFSLFLYTYLFRQQQEVEEEEEEVRSNNIREKTLHYRLGRRKRERRKKNKERKKEKGETGNEKRGRKNLLL